MNLNHLGFALLLSACLVGQAKADVIYSYSTDMTNYTGSSVTVNVYLNETLTKGAQSIIGPNGSEAGVFAAGVAINLVSGNATITAITANTTAFGGPVNPGSNSSNPALTATSAALSEQIAFGATAPKASALSSTVNQLFLGSFTITAGSGTSTFSVTSFGNSVNGYAQSQGDSTITSPGGIPLDQSSSTSGFTGADGSNIVGTEDSGAVSFTVSPQQAGVPEPSSMALCGLALGGMGFGYWRRRKAKLAGEAEVAETPAVV